MTVGAPAQGVLQTTRLMTANAARTATAPHSFEPAPRERARAPREQDGAGLSNDLRRARVAQVERTRSGSDNFDGATRADPRRARRHLYVNAVADGAP